MDAAYRAGLFTHLGVCNISPSMLEEWLQVSSVKGFVKPSIYQGQYNLLCRTYEEVLFPLLRRNDISFVAYSPLAGGFLTGKLTFSEQDEDLKGTRFEVSETNFGGMRYRSFYDKNGMHAAVISAEQACRSHGINLADAALRWLLYHSSLDGTKGDSVVIGPNGFRQLAGYISARNEGHLPGDIVQALDALWSDIKPDAAGIIQY